MIQLLAHTGRQFGLDAADQQGVGVASIMPQFFGDQAQPDVLVAVRAWTSALVAALDRQDTHVAVGDPPRLDLRSRRFSTRPTITSAPP